MDYVLHYYECDDVRVVPLAGEFDLSLSKALEEFITAAHDGSKSVVIDLSGASYIDSTVLTVLVRQKKALGSYFRVVVPKTAKLRRIFEITQLQTQLEIEESLAAGMGSRVTAELPVTIVA